MLIKARRLCPPLQRQLTSRDRGAANKTSLFRGSRKIMAFKPEVKWKVN